MDCPEFHTKIKVKPNLWYLFDISPVVQYQHISLDSVQRFKAFRSMMYEFFLPFKAHGIDYEAHIEIADPLGEFPDYNNFPKLHIHCNIKMNEKGVFNLLMLHMPRALKYGRVKLDTIADYEDRIKYITKQAWLFESQDLNPVLTNFIKMDSTLVESLGDSGDQESPALSDSESFALKAKGPKAILTPKRPRKKRI